MLKSFSLNYHWNNVCGWDSPWEPWHLHDAITISFIFNTILRLLDFPGKRQGKRNVIVQGWSGHEKRQSAASSQHIFDLLSHYSRRPSTAHKKRGAASPENKKIGQEMPFNIQSNLSLANNKIHIKWIQEISTAALKCHLKLCCTNCGPNQQI